MQSALWAYCFSKADPRIPYGIIIGYHIALGVRCYEDYLVSDFEEIASFSLDVSTPAS